MKLQFLILFLCILLPSLLPAQQFRFMNSNDAEEFLEGVLSEFGLTTNDIKIVPSDRTNNANANVESGTPYIYYNPDWMRSIGSTYGDLEYWLKMGVITHELGHHMKGHTITFGGSTPLLELEADLWAGFAMRKFGATLEQALIAVRRTAPQFATATHPARLDREKAVTAGYRGEPYSPPEEYNSPPTEKSNRSNAKTVTLAGETYPVKTFGGLTWMTKNLNYKVWGSWVYDKDMLRWYGRLYTWEAAKKACEKLGWRLPTDQEWRELTRDFGGADVDASDQGRAAFEALTDGGESKFDARLGGFRSPNRNFFNFGRKFFELNSEGYYWSGTEYDADNARSYMFLAPSSMVTHRSFGIKGKSSTFRFSSHADGNLIRGYHEKSSAFSCRCVKD